jgi:hypothetical protein
MPWDIAARRRTRRMPGAALLAACMLLAQGACGSGPEITAAAQPRITDLSASPNPARAGDVVEVRFTAIDAGGGVGGDWMAFLDETPAAGGQVDPQRNRDGIRTSPASISFRYRTQSPTTARVDVWLFAYGTCRGLFCEAPFNKAEGSVTITVLAR